MSTYEYPEGVEYKTGGAEGDTVEDVEGPDLPPPDEDEPEDGG